jgi:hypothetical protein
MRVKREGGKKEGWERKVRRGYCHCRMRKGHKVYVWKEIRIPHKWKMKCKSTMEWGRDSDDMGKDHQ